MRVFTIANALIGFGVFLSVLDIYVIIRRRIRGHGTSPVFPAEVILILAGMAVLGFQRHAADEAEPQPQAETPRSPR